MTDNQDAENKSRPRAQDEPGKPLPVAQLIGQVSRRIGAVAKERKTEMGAGGGNYKFRGIDDVLDAVHGPLADAGIVTLTEIVDVERSERPRPNKSSQTVVHLRLRVRFVGPAGDELTAEGLGEAQDYGDKATAKAHSVAFRTIMVQVFTIPFSDSSVNVDSENDNDLREPITTINLRPFLEREIPEPARRKEFSETWKGAFNFPTTSVPVEREEEARQIISVFAAFVPEPKQTQEPEKESVK